MGITLFRAIRRSTQVFGLVLSNVYISVFVRGQIYKGPFKSVCVPFLYCHACPTATFSCPIGAVQHFMAIHKFPFFIVGHFALLGLLVGRTACGWLCPFGLLQDLLYRLETRKIRIPRAFSIGPYVVLLLLVLMLPFVTSEHWFSKLCPVGTLVAGIPWVAWNPVNPETGEVMIAANTLGFLFVTKLAILGGFLGLFVVAKRPFCRFVCPVGLFLSFFNKISILKLKVTEDCDRCDTCRKMCPMDIKVYEDPNSGDCIRCLDCTACAKVTVTASLPGCPTNAASHGTATEKAVGAKTP
ncbi:4Fe-4S binding protein [Verrucomicrobiota bacterium]